MLKEQIAKVNKSSAEQPWGMACSVDVYGCDADSIRDEAIIRRYVKELVELIEMKAFGPCHVVHFGEDEKVEGFSMFQLIETSSISGHFANLTNTAYIDIFSCKSYEVADVAEFTQEFFKGKYVRMNINDRV
jgi:S-adenosylmethionine/arginine decarboxylase-like enzyme